MATTGFQPAAQGASEDEDDATCAVPLPIREAVLRDILMSGFVTDAKMGPAALSLSSVLVRAFVECVTHHPLRTELVSRPPACPIVMRREAWHRAAAVAQHENEDEDETAVVTPEHLEQVLPQLLLDFGP